MKIVWAMLPCGVLLQYDGVLRTLAQRGHEVVIAWPAGRGRAAVDRAAGERLAAAFSNISIVRAPAAGGTRWSVLTGLTRRMRDYLRLYEPAYAAAGALRARAAAGLPPTLAALCRAAGRVAPLRRLLRRALASVEHVAPAPAAQLEFLRAARPDVVAVTPLVDHGSPQVDLVKAARRLGVPTVLGLSGWDDLSARGVLHVVPDRILAWSEGHRADAVSGHGVRPTQVIVTGGHAFDRWFAWQATESRAAFCARAGLPDARPYLLYVGAPAVVAAREARVVERWLRELRAADDERLRGLAVLIRPHPGNLRSWFSTDLTVFGPVALWPPDDTLPIDTEPDDDFAASVYFSAAVVGIDPARLIEAAILGRPASVIRHADTAPMEGGLPRSASFGGAGAGFVFEHETWAEQFAFLARALAETGLGAQHRELARAYVRPNGAGEAVVPRVADAVEAVAALSAETAPRPNPIVARLVLGPVAWLAAFLWPNLEPRPVWTLPLRVVISSGVALLVAVHHVRALSAAAFTGLREGWQLARKRTRRAVHVAAFESRQAIAHSYRRTSKRLTRLFWRSGSAVKQRMRGVAPRQR